MHVHVDVVELATIGDAAGLRAVLAQNPGLAATYSPEGWTPLHLTAYFGHVVATRTLVGYGADVNAVSNNAQRNTPLHAALAGARPTEIARLLLAHGADPNARQQGGITALHAAAQNGDLTAAHLLLDAGAQLEAATESGDTALSLALKAGQVGVADLIQEYRSRR